MKFRLLLLAIYVRLFWLSHFNRQFQQRVSGKDFCFYFGLMDSSIGRSFRISHGRISSRSGDYKAADIHISFCSEEYGHRMLLTAGRKPLRFADGMNKNRIVVRGTVDYLFWLMDIGRYLPLKKNSRVNSLVNFIVLAFSKTRVGGSR